VESYVTEEEKVLVCVCVCVVAYLSLLFQVLLYKTLSATYSSMGFKRKASMMAHYAALQSFKLCQSYSHPQALYQVHISQVVYKMFDMLFIITVTYNYNYL